MMLLHCALEGLLVSQTASSWIHFGWQSEQLDLGLKRIEFRGLRRVCLPSRDTPLPSRTQAMLSYRLRVGRKKATRHCQKIHLYVKSLILTSTLWSNSRLQYNQWDRGLIKPWFWDRDQVEFIRRTLAADWLSPGYSKEFISIWYHHSIAAKNNYSLKYITTGQLSSSHFWSRNFLFKSSTEW